MGVPPPGYGEKTVYINRAIFRLTKLAFLRARAIPREKIFSLGIALALTKANFVSRNIAL